jgi:hypothetical protein
VISHIAELHHESKLHIYQCSKDDLRTRRALSSRDQIYSQDRLVQQTGRRAQWQSRSHFLPDRRFSTLAIHSNNCFITGPSGNSLAASIALACSGGRWVNRGGIYLFFLFLPDSLRVVLSLSIYHCSQKLRHNSVFHLAGSPKSVFCPVFGQFRFVMQFRYM